jgi:hypothetical protein
MPKPWRRQVFRGLKSGLARRSIGEGGLRRRRVAAEASWEICGEKIQNNVDTLLRIQLKRISLGFAALNH